MPALRGLRAGLFQDCGGTAGSATPHPALIPQPLWGRKANAVKNRREPSPARPPSSEASGRWRSRLLLGAWRATHHFCSRLFLVFLERSDSKHRERGSPCLLLLWDLLAGTRAAGSGWNSTVRCRLHLSQPHVPTGTFHPAGRSHRAAPEGALDPVPSPHAVSFSWGQTGPAPRLTSPQCQPRPSSTKPQGGHTVIAVTCTTRDGGAGPQDFVQ